jgi:hypothetical protein
VSPAAGMPLYHDTEQDGADRALIEEVATGLWCIEGNYHREGSGPGSRFAGQRLEVVQARWALRRVREHDRSSAAPPPHPPVTSAPD